MQDDWAENFRNWRKFAFQMYSLITSKAAQETCLFAFLLRGTKVLCVNGITGIHR